MLCINCGKALNVNWKFCKSCGAIITVPQNQSSETLSIESNKKNHKKLFVILGILLLIIIGFSIYYVISKNSSDSKDNQNQAIISVVNVLCDNEEGGSGTLILEEGDIVTNNHVVSRSEICLVTIPNSITGAPEEIYVAEPVMVPNLSEQYDIAVLRIISAYKDEEGKEWGVYPKTFSVYKNPSKCSGFEPLLGDGVRIYGYPAVSGGYNLTITEGVISSFSDNGDILTSANIDSGNSGGLAVDQDGCMLGIPSAVFTGNYANLGVIIPVNVISEFFNKAGAQLSSPAP